MQLTWQSWLHVDIIELRPSSEGDGLNLLAVNTGDRTDLLTHHTLACLVLAMKMFSFSKVQRKALFI